MPRLGFSTKFQLPLRLENDFLKIPNQILYIDPKRKLDYEELEDRVIDQFEHDYMLDSFSYETLEGMEDDMTNGLIQLLEVVDYTPLVPKLIVIDDLDFIVRTPTVDRLSQGV